MNFGAPKLLWLLLLVPVLVTLVWWSFRARRRAMAQFVGSRLLASLTVGLSRTRQKLRAALLLAGVALALFSMARPQWGYGLEEAKQRGLDVVIAIDTSKSMLADDIQPNRLKRAKLAALDLMRLSKSDRLGLVAFAGSAFLQCPLSLDDEAFRQSVEMLDVNIIPQGGTAIAEAIQTAVAAFKEKTENHRILVLFTDGEDNEGETEVLAAAREARKQGLRVFTVGVGTPSGELLSTSDPYGNRVFIKDDKGNVVKSRLNETLLRDIAKETDAFYVPLAGASTMEILYERGLAPLPKSEFAATTVRQYYERYQWFLAAALLLLLAEMFFPERARRATAKAAATIALLLFASQNVFAGSSPDGALKLYRDGDYAKAHEEYELLARKKPGDARLWFNAGVAAYEAKDYNAASNCFVIATTNSSVKLQQGAYYNLGSVQFRIGEKVEDWDGKMRVWENSVKSFKAAVTLRTNDINATYNLQLVQANIDALKYAIWMREEDRKAKRLAEQEAARGQFAAALQRLLERKQKNPDNKELDDFIQRLKELYEIDRGQQPQP